MSFQRSSPLPPKYRVISGAVLAAEHKIAAAWPKKVWSEGEVLSFQSASFPSLSVVDALVAIGVFRKRSTKRHGEHNFFDEDGWEEHSDHYDEVVTYEVIGNLMALINELTNTPGAIPYFISFHSDGGRAEATQLHNALQAVGVPGFLSDDQQTGAQYRHDILVALRAAGTVFLIESPQYHTRARCIVERDFATAAGKRILRIGLCPLGSLQLCPTWLNGNIQCTNFAASGTFDLNSTLALSLSQPLALDIRKRGGIELIGKLTQVKLGDLAAKLGVEEQLDGSIGNRRTQFATIAFASPTEADRFAAEIDLLPMF